MSASLVSTVQENKSTNYNTHFWIQILVFSFVLDNYNAQIAWNTASEQLPSSRAAQVTAYDSTTGLAWILGGWTSGTTYSDIYSYNLSSGNITHRGQLSIGDVAMNLGQVWTTIGTIIYFVKDRNTNNISTFDMNIGKIISNDIPTAPMSEPVECMASYLNKYLIAISYTFTDIYDFQTKQWLLTVPSLNTAREGTSCQVYGESVYIFGGRNGGNTHLNTIEKLNLTTLNSWQILSNTMSFTSYVLRTTLVGDKIFVTGGYNGGYLNKVDAFSTLDESVTVETPLPLAINRHGIITGLNDEIRIIGGRGIGSTVYKDIQISVIPTVSPSVHPTDFPTTVPPSQYPTVSPTIDPTEIPTINPTNVPTVSPTIDPTKFLTINPTFDPTINPTNNPSINPTSDPTNDPTTDPTFNPTYAPTYCFNAKYQYEMFGIEKDNLLSDETLVSNNCMYVVKMYRNGNLILHEYSGNILNTFNDLWMTNTTIYNHSGKSFPQLVIENGQVKIIEYLYKNVPAVPVIDLWTSDNMEVENKNDIILTLTDDGCLVLTDVVDIFEHNYIWKQCIKTTTDTPIDDTMISTDYISDDSTDDEKNNNYSHKETADRLWWVWLLIILTIFIGFFICFFIRKYYINESNQKWRTADATTHHVENEYNTKENDICAQETDQIDEWIKETEMENIQFVQQRNSLEYNEGKTNYHASVFNTEMVFDTMDTKNVTD